LELGATLAPRTGKIIENHKKIYADEKFCSKRGLAPLQDGIFSQKFLGTA